jgi:hypothetical protein
LLLAGAVFLIGYFLLTSSLKEGAGPAPVTVPEEATAPQTMPQISGITTEDQEPNGCVSCHRLREDIGMDFRLSTQLKRWSTDGVPEELLELAQRAAPAGMTLTGSHPDVAERAMTEPIPELCLGCHSKDSSIAPPLARLLHLIKFAQPDDLTQNHFITAYGGQCTHCHALNKENGQWFLKSGTESD